MIRRRPEAVVLAHTMDRSRKELYVEGKRDRLFLSWLLEDRMGRTSIVKEIEFVDLPGDIPGGEKGRLVYFASWLGIRDVQIRMFADADWDRLLGRVVPERIWLTDNRDMEGYVLTERCFDKVLRLGLATDRISGRNLLTIVRQLGRQLGLIRMMSELDNLDLPFQHTRLDRHLNASAGMVSLDLQGYLRALLQNALISLAQLAGTNNRLAEVSQAYAATPDSEIIHGKDAVCVLEAALSSLGVSPGEGCRLLWTSFDPAFVGAGTTLAAVMGFLQE